MSEAHLEQPGVLLPRRLAALGGVVLLALLAGYRAWADILTIGWEDPEQSQVLLAVPAFLALLWFRRQPLSKITYQSSVYGVALAGLGWAMTWYGYVNAVQSVWHIGALLMVIGAAWSVLGNRALWVGLPAVIALAALVPVPNLLRQDIALPLQRVTAQGAEFVLVAFGFEVKRAGMTLFYQEKPVTIEEACNGMRMVFALALVSFTFVMSLRLTLFARLMLLGVAPLLAVLCNIIRVVPTVVIYGRYGDGAGDMFHDLSGWAMIVLSAMMLLGLIRLLTWAQVPIYADRAPLPAPPIYRRLMRHPMPWLVAPACVAALLAGATLHTLSMPSAGDAQAYHLAIKQTSINTTNKVTGLASRPIDMPEGSLKLLRPNTSRAIEYTDEYSGASCQFLLIQSRDARDLSGHYPPRCYPNVYGYVEVGREHKQWTVDGVTINGTEYTFAQSGRADAPRWVVLHFFALPNGGTTGELSDMRHAAADYLKRHHGAAQVQLLFRESQASPRQRDKMFGQVMRAHRDLLGAILNGPRG